jgi:hypothetical protein
MYTQILLQIIFLKKPGEMVTSATNRGQDPSLNTATSKSVTFGGVTKKIFKPKEAITSSTNDSLYALSKSASITLKTGVFSRLGS